MAKNRPVRPAPPRARARDLLQVVVHAIWRALDAQVQGGHLLDGATPDAATAGALVTGPLADVDAAIPAARDLRVRSLQLSTNPGQLQREL